MNDTPHSVFLADDAATAALAQRIARSLRPGDLVLLEGGLGAGKTALARGIIRTLVGDQRLEVPSPSFALVQPYNAGGIPVLHADLYRLASAHDVEELGLFDRADAIVLVEWPERAPGLGEEATMRIEIGIPAGGAGRQATVEAADGRRV